MPNNYYERQSEMNPGELADGLAIEQEFDAIGRGFAKLPDPHRDGKGFEGPTRVGDPVEETDAVNLGTLEKLNLPIYRKKITTEDWNTIADAGIYDVVNASGINAPSAYPYGVLIVHAFNGVITQLYYPDKNCGLIKRVCQSIAAQQWLGWDASYSASMGASGFRNKVINGDFRVNQRAYASGAATTVNQYTLDRWKVSGTAGITFVTLNGKKTVTIPAGQTLKQIIEGFNLTAGDYVLSWGGTAQARINSGPYGASGSVKVSLTGGLDTTIEFSAGTLEFVQFEMGSVSTPFENRHYGYELGLCQRYYFSPGNKFYYTDGNAFGNWGGATSVCGIRIKTPVEMRVAPTLKITSGYVTAPNGANAGEITTIQNQVYSANTLYFESVGHSGLVGGQSCSVVFIANGLSLDAEL